MTSVVVNASNDEEWGPGENSLQKLIIKYIPIMDSSELYDWSSKKVMKIFSFHTKINN